MSTSGKILLTSFGKDVYKRQLLESLEDHIEKATGFHVLDHELKFYGLCKDCMKKQR